MSEWLHGLKGLIALLGSLVTVVGSLVGILIATNVINVGGGGQPENKPPVVGSIFLENPVAVPGKSTRAEITVSDPERDTLDIRWTADSGSFDQGNSGSSVIYQPPAAGASVQLTVEVSDGKNAPVTVSKNFNLATPIPVPVVTATPPTAVNPATIIPPAESPTLTPLPPTEAFDLTGRWEYALGTVVFREISIDNYEFVDYNLLGVSVGEGLAEVEQADSLVYLDATTYLDGSSYSIDLEIIDDFSMAGIIYDSFDNPAGVIALSRLGS